MLDLDSLSAAVEFLSLRGADEDTEIVIKGLCDGEQSHVYRLRR